MTLCGRPTTMTGHPPCKNGCHTIWLYEPDDDGSRLIKFGGCQLHLTAAERQQIAEHEAAARAAQEARQAEQARRQADLENRIAELVREFGWWNVEQTVHQRHSLSANRGDGTT